MQNFDGKHEDIAVVCFKTILLLKAEWNIGARGEIATAEKVGRFQCSHDVTCIKNCINEYKQEKERINPNCHWFWCCLIILF